MWKAITQIQHCQLGEVLVVIDNDLRLGKATFSVVPVSSCY